MEQWKDIKDYEGLYQVSNLGRVKSLNYLGHGREKILKPGMTCHGYYFFYLCKNGNKKMAKIHRLVYQAFNGELIDGLVIDHISGIKTQNNIENLQQINNRENTVKGNTTKNRSSKYVGVCWYKQRNKWLSRIKIQNRYKFLGYFDDEEEAARAYQNALEGLNQID